MDQYTDFDVTNGTIKALMLGATRIALGFHQVELSHNPYEIRIRSNMIAALLPNIWDIAISATAAPFQKYQLDSLFSAYKICRDSTDRMEKYLTYLEL